MSRVILTSFGNKYPATEATKKGAFDVEFNCLSIPNPHWMFSDHCGKEECVQLWLRGEKGYRDHLERFKAIIRDRIFLPNQTYRIGVFCSGGRHRSVTIVEDLAKWMREMEVDVEVTHATNHCQCLNQPPTEAELDRSSFYFGDC